MDRPKVTPKDFFLWFGAMVALYSSLFAFISLIFSYLNYSFPDRLDYFTGDPYSNGVAYYMASLIVMYPVFWLLMRTIHRSIETDPSRAEVWVRRWALYLTLFIAGLTIVGDLITLVMYFFQGDTSVRFYLKVLVVLLVAGGGFLHFLADLRGYWDRERAKARMVGWATVVLAILTIIAGFFIIGTPWEARLYRYDEEKVNDLQNIQYQVLYYWQAKHVLPKFLVELDDPLRGFVVPMDPQTDQSYVYRPTGARTFELCATFNAESREGSIISRPYPSGETWQHGAGTVCFARTIDPELNSPVPKPL